MRLFDVLGPVMIGPSSSHTAGAARIGYTAQKLLGEVPAKADIGLYGSFATTGKGHGTDRALVAIDGVPADFGGDSNTLIIHNEDTPGCIAEVTMSLALRRINIASMQVFRAAVGRYAVMVLECDSHIPHTLEQQLAVMPGLLKVTCLNVDEPEGMEE